MSVDEWDQRMPCPDGACIGLIGGDGLCKVCGRAAPNWGDERKRGQVVEDDDDDEDDLDASETDDAYDEDDDDDDDGEDDDEEQAADEVDEDDGDDEDDDVDDDDDEDDDDEDADEDHADRVAFRGDDGARPNTGNGAAHPNKRGGEWSKRRLCSDGACIGVIGANGKCTVCGKPP
jgi:hypothetical protein